MSYLKRTLDLRSLLEKKSFFLFGPRGTGKSSLIKHTLGEDTVTINLLRTEYQMRLAAEPHTLQDIIKAEQNSKQDLIVIDEIQKIPILLDEVHRLIEEEGIRLLLTGSSARRLKQHSVNLLGGRARRAELFPFTRQEIPDFKLERYLRFGGLPPVWLSEEPEEELDAYVGNYINEEIKAEGAIRKFPPFVGF
ncbi:MAG: AAA family ATPase [Deltaproteobacteria bacterium]|nr:AAA family ATPase [Deltaproteobacteria bacterium]